jgi:hypothetical protein
VWASSSPSSPLPQSAARPGSLACKFWAHRPVGSVRIRDLGRLSSSGRQRLPSSRPVAVTVAVDGNGAITA